MDKPHAKFVQIVTSEEQGIVAALDDDGVIWNLVEVYGGYAWERCDYPRKP